MTATPRMTYFCKAGGIRPCSQLTSNTDLRSGCDILYSHAEPLGQAVIGSPKQTYLYIIKVEYLECVPTQNL